ncbi:efflux transporter periplasmic adaptor subunit [Pseudoxanthomonas broegbernensis]|uniref:Efflux transporter periplasmic adaptor subunit n=1 Tax=Pseudoxanthomonas broegbernensis TaxID=83619 RepID=A0A7V8GKY5_9GAMM|nr:efflux RND transporter periplasmic adaptor subunit [Pseudoxanthomonas broegbernensis]KAF1685359.1 efflux transporter periplasmic adaptor subunit [Pseudoxanthomonas broegbernensis]MBB6066433.1 RND family efflux transporter MFP subunit [Pseudoxanthomonas broegbernensis]
MKPIRIPAVLRARWVLPALAAAGVFAAAGYLLSGDAVSAKVSDGKAPPLVELVTSTMMDLPHIVEAQGHVVPVNEVEVRPQIDGMVASLDFQEGQDVTAGQLLFVLDGGDAPALVRQARARYAQASAELDDARRNHARSKELVASRYISPSALDAAASKVEMLQAQQQAARAEIESSQVREGYSRIVAPISGRAGAIAVRRGALVRPSDSVGLVRIVQIDPIAVEFSLPERELGGLTQALKRGQAAVSADTAQGPMDGTLVFTDNSIDPATGTIRLKARFDNADERLWPGAFVNLRVTAGVKRDAVVLPPQALLEGPDGHFVYQVDADGRARMRPVAFAGIQDGRAVVTGLPAGEAIVSEGNQSIRDGMSVRVPAAAGEAQ